MTTKRPRRVTVTPRCNPGRKLFRAVTRKKNPLKIEDMTDGELLRYVLSEKAAASVAEALQPHGGLRGFVKLGEGGPGSLARLHGVDESTAARLLVIWELAARISAPYIEEG